MTFLSTSMMVVIIFLLPVRKVCTPSLKRKMTVNELLNIWNMEGIFLERDREREREKETETEREREQKKSFFFQIFYDEKVDKTKKKLCLNKGNNKESPIEHVRKIFQKLTI